MTDNPIQIGQTAIDPETLLLALAGSSVFILLVLLTVAIVYILKRGREAEERTGEATMMRADMAKLEGRLQTLAEISVSRQAESTRAFNDRLDKVSHRMGQSLTETSRKTNDSLSKLYERLAVIDSAQRNLTELSSNVVTLQEILADKQTRGAFGQGRMEAIVKDGLPRDTYTFQATLSNGKRPDCLIKLPNAPALVVDAKFPLEGFEAFRRARTEVDKKQATQRVRQDVSRHIEAISERYLLPGETQDSGLMFVPSEAIYADLHENFSELLQKAHRARVVLVSPNLLMLAVQTMQAILKDVRMREQAGLIQREVSYLMEDVNRLRGRTLDLQRHFGQANQDIEKILTSSEKIGNRGMRIENLDFEAEAPKDSKDKTGTGATKSKPASKAGVEAKPRARRNGGDDQLAAGE
jgi:DNA recombination protein RmuC